MSSAPGPRVLRPVTRAPATSDAASRYIDEDVSWLEGGARLLALAEDETLPATERVALLAAAGRALDAFFQLRGPDLRDAAARDARKARAVRARVEELADRKAHLLRGLVTVLSAEGHALCHWDSLHRTEQGLLSELFRERHLPALGPLVTPPGGPIPEPATLSLTVVAALMDPEGEPSVGSVELPPVLERLVAVPASARYAAGGRFVPLEDLVVAHLPELFCGLSVQTHALYRVTRHGGVQVPTDAHDVLTAMETRVRNVRAGAPVRLEVDHRIEARLRQRLAGELELGKLDVYPVHGLMGIADLAGFGKSWAPDIGLSRATPRLPSRVLASEAEDPFVTLDQRETLVHLPHDTGGVSVTAVLARAARDPRVVAIKQTLYRPDPDGPVVRALVRAAERGTHVVALVELGARLSQRASIACARALERAGAHVVYGLAGLRTHCSVSFVVCQDGGEVRRYSLVASGTHDGARRPEALVFASSDPILAADMADLFNYLTGYSRPTGYRKLVVAPAGMRAALVGMINAQAAQRTAGWVGLKVGRLSDKEVVEALYAASAAGVNVEIVVTGACVVRPGVAGLSENIRVLAPSGRHAETSRCFGFGRGDERLWYVSSADLARRNLDREVDVAVPVEDPWCAKRLDESFGAMVDGAAWLLGPDGAWRRCSGSSVDRGRWRSRGTEPQAATFSL